MLVDPPIDKLIEKADCRYELVLGVVARAKQLMAQESDYLAESGLKPISLAAKEVYEDKVVINKK